MPIDAPKLELARRWLLDQPPEERSMDQLLAGFGERLNAAGVPVWRISTGLNHFDPYSVGTYNTWGAASGARTVVRTHEEAQRTYPNSPAQSAIQFGREIACRLDVPEKELPLPMLAELRAQGATGYLSMPIPMSEALSAARFTREGRAGWIAYATTAPGGFREEEYAALRGLAPEAGIRIALEASKSSARSLLSSYLGQNATAHVLGGKFRRGSSQAISAVIWYCDMRGFTALSDSSSAADVVRVLDRYFECVAGSIETRGGEVLKFIGDAVLAVFPTSAAHGALAAARDARTQLASLNAERRATGAGELGCGIALHVGEVMYGNIGSARRLDFTVIGAPVNEVCRVEPLTRTLGVDVLLTAQFVAAANLDGVKSLGKHALKGVREPQEIFTLD